MSAISDQKIRLIFIALFIFTLLFYRGNLPVTYSYFTAKVGAEVLVLETGVWEVEAEMSFFSDPAEPQTRSGLAVDNKATTITAEVRFPDKVNVEEIDLSTISLEYKENVIRPLAGLEQYLSDKLSLQFDREELAKLVEGEEGEVPLLLSGKGEGFSFTAKGVLPLILVEPEVQEDDLLEEATIKIEGDCKVLIPVEGEVKASYFALVSDSKEELLPDMDIEWRLKEEVAGVSFDEKKATLVVNSDALPGCVILVASAVSDPGLVDELIVALVEEEKPEQRESEAPEPEAVDEVKDTEKERETEDTDGFLKDEDDVDSDESGDELSEDKECLEKD